MQERNIKYSVQPKGREKGCFETIIKKARSEFNKGINKKGKKFHGYGLTVSYRKEKHKSRQDGIFETWMLRRDENIQPTFNISSPPQVFKTTVEQNNECLTIITKAAYHNTNVIGSEEQGRTTNVIARGIMSNFNTPRMKTHSLNNNIQQTFHRNGDISNMVNLSRHQTNIIADNEYLANYQTSAFDQQLDQDICSEDLTTHLSDISETQVISSNTLSNNVIPLTHPRTTNHPPNIHLHSSSEYTNIVSNNVQHQVPMNEGLLACRFIVDTDTDIECSNVELTNKRQKQSHSNNPQNGKLISATGTVDKATSDDMIDSEIHANEHIDDPNLEIYIPEKFKLLRKNNENKCWEVLIKWTDYAETYDTWENASKFVLDKAYEMLVPDLLTAMRIKTLPDFNIIRKKVKKKKHTKTKVSRVVNKCKYQDNHKSKENSMRIRDLVGEENKAYINEGYYLHENKCDKCCKLFVNNIADSSKQVTINSNNKAWHCPNSTSGCKYVLCHICYTQILVQQSQYDGDYRKSRDSEHSRPTRSRSHLV